MKTALLIDIDGTCISSGKMIDGANDTILHLKEMEYSIRFLTNIDSKTKEELSSGLANIGLKIRPEEIFTATDACVHYLRTRNAKSVISLVPKSISAQFDGFRTESLTDFVVLGDQRETCEYSSYNKAFQAIMNGASLLALQKGKFFVSDEGPQLDTGAFVSMLEFSTGKQAIIMGKPSKEFFLGAIKSISRETQSGIVVGDDITTDIAGANQLDWPSVLVHTGKYNLQKNLDSQYSPTCEIESIRDLPDIIESICKLNKAGMPNNSFNHELCRPACKSNV